MLSMTDETLLWARKKPCYNFANDSHKLFLHLCQGQLIIGLLAVTKSQVEMAQLVTCSLESPESPWKLGYGKTFLAIPAALLTIFASHCFTTLLHNSSAPSLRRRHERSCWLWRREGRPQNNRHYSSNHTELPAFETYWRKRGTAAAAAAAATKLLCLGCAEWEIWSSWRRRRYLWLGGGKRHQEISSFFSQSAFLLEKEAGKSCCCCWIQLFLLSCYHRWSSYTRRWLRCRQHQPWAKVAMLSMTLVFH